MPSILQQHRKRLQEQQDQGVTEPAKSNTAPQLQVGSKVQMQQNGELMARAMEEDLKSLKNIKSTDHKVQLKRDELVPKYQAFVEAIMNANQVHSILAQIMVWLFDIADIMNATRLAEYCLAHNISMPERFSRDISSFVCDEILMWSEAEHEAGRSPNPFFNDQFAAIELGVMDMPDNINARYYKLSGLIASETGDFETAVKHLQRALDLGALVKKKLADATKALEKQKKQVPVASQEEHSDPEDTDSEGTDSEDKAEEA